MTTIADCNNKRHVNRPMQRESDGDTISTSGVILLGQLIDDNTFFNVRHSVSLSSRASVRSLTHRSATLLFRGTSNN